MHRRRILLVEDRPADVRLTQRALKKAGFTDHVEVAENGKEALDRLRGVNGHANKPRPDLVILDWMMPLVNGEEVLEEMRADPQLKSMPVVVLTTSNNEVDVNAAYGLGCNAYLVKPVDPSEFQKAVEAMGIFWLRTALLPKG